MRSLPPSDAPEGEKQPEGERCWQIPPTLAARLSEALLASDKSSCGIAHVVRVMEGGRDDGG